MTDEAKALVEECRLDAKAFRENTVYDSDGDPIRLIANADRLDQYADLIETQAREIERLRGALEQIAQADYGYTDIIESGAPPEKHADYFCSMVAWRQRTARAALAGDSHDRD